MLVVPVIHPAFMSPPPQGLVWSARHDNCCRRAGRCWDVCVKQPRVSAARSVQGQALSTLIGVLPSGTYLRRYASAEDWARFGALFARDGVALDGSRVSLRCHELRGCSFILVHRDLDPSAWLGRILVNAGSIVSHTRVRSSLVAPTSIPSDGEWPCPASAHATALF